MDAKYGQNWVERPKNGEKEKLGGEEEKNTRPLEVAPGPRGSFEFCFFVER